MRNRGGFLWFGSSRFPISFYFSRNDKIHMHYLERLRTEYMTSGRCDMCGNFSKPLERHHESYKPERTMNLCHKCHFKTHFLPWELTDSAKEKLLRARHGHSKTITEEMKRQYLAPGRRPAQLQLRKKLR